MSIHTHFMLRALLLAERGLYTAHPNPMVGCVIVKDGTIVGEGWHIKPGTPHAECHALQQAGTQATGADVYITLEPCSHFGRTPPCVSALIAAKVKRVIIPFTDPNPKVNGQGLDQLRQAGIEIIIGIEAEKAAALNRFFLTAMQKQRPYVIAKWAMTLDGQLTLADPQQRWISNEAARQHTHHYRARVGAIAVGANTLRLDQPLLTARPQDVAPEIIQHPLRLILSREGKVDIHYLRQLPGATRVVTAQASSNENPEYLPFPAKHHNDIDLSQLLTWLVQQEKYSLLVEGGKQILAAFFAEDLVDEIHIYQSMQHSQLTDPALPFLNKQKNWTVVETQHFGSDIFIRAIKDV